jgi:hypothetical protein
MRRRIRVCRHGLSADLRHYPLANKLEGFVIALANMDVAVMLRIERFRSTFFTGVTAESVIQGRRADFYDDAPADANAP